MEQVIQPKVVYKNSVSLNIFHTREIIMIIEILQPSFHDGYDLAFNFVVLAS